MNFLLKNIKWLDGETVRCGDVRIGQGKILDIGDKLTSGKRDRTLDLENHYLYRGLINSHDHLEMNLYPLMGTPPYSNYTEWARDIYKPENTPVKEIEAVSKRLRLLAGGIKNLISGVTTVVHHNPWHYSMSYQFPIRVLKAYAWAHSHAFEKKLNSKFPTRKSTPFIIHAAEGVDDFARDEIVQLSKSGVLRPNTVVVHGVGIDEEGASLMEQAGAAVVWCPTSNYFMFNKTAPISSLKKRVTVALGTDATMTGSVTLLEEMRAALKSGEASANEIFNMVTVNAEKIFNLPARPLAVGAAADLLIAPIENGDYHQNLFQQNSTSLRAVLIGGALRYADPIIANDLGSKGFVQKINGREKWVAMDIGLLKKKILASRGMTPAILENNPFWRCLH